MMAIKKNYLVSNIITIDLNKGLKARDKKD